MFPPGQFHNKIVRLQWISHLLTQWEALSQLFIGPDFSCPEKLDTTCCPKLKWTNGSIGRHMLANQAAKVGSGIQKNVFLGFLSDVFLGQEEMSSVETTLHARATQRSAVFPGSGWHLFGKCPFWTERVSCFFLLKLKSGEAWPSLKLTASLHLKMDAFQYHPFFLE